MSKKKDSKATGWVYVLSHKHHKPLKIGFTTRTVDIRIDEIERSTGVLRGYSGEFAVQVNNPRALEAAVHRALAEKRTFRNKEFFEISVEQAASVIKRVASEKGFKISRTLNRNALRAAQQRQASANSSRTAPKPWRKRMVYLILLSVCALGAYGAYSTLHSNPAWLGLALENPPKADADQLTHTTTGLLEHLSAWLHTLLDSLQSREADSEAQPLPNLPQLNPELSPLLRPSDAGE